ncbi:MAG TPA: DUF4185 domain-containing protein [Verrucomicrobiae bacterium]|nr:DUF4185 domain-containing protein [Verrucomicrobiae bacterium]
MLLLIGSLALGQASSHVGGSAPYPPSNTIGGITWDWQTYTNAAPGSDLWPVTWGPDDELYAAWGDGGGFGGSDSDGRVALGIARIEGSAEHWHGLNINGGKNPQYPASFAKKGKTTGIAFVDGVLYATVNLEDGTWPDVNHALFWSTNQGATWTRADWLFPKGAGNFQPAKFLAFGKDYTGVPTPLAGYVYLYGPRQSADRGSGSALYLARVPRNRMRDRSAYEYFRAAEPNGAVWAGSIAEARPVFIDTNGVTPASAVYDPGLKRYLMTCFHVGPGQLGIFDAPNPWGPWSTIAYYEDWGQMGPEGEGLTCGFPQKWMSPDGLTLWCIFSVYGEGAKRGIQAHDRFNLVKATLLPERRLNNIVSELLVVNSTADPRKPYTFNRAHDGWTYVSVSFRGQETPALYLDDEMIGASARHTGNNSTIGEWMHWVNRGGHSLRFEPKDNLQIESVTVKAIPELIHCGLGFDSQIKSYGKYDLSFLSEEVLPNITTLIVPTSLVLTQTVIEDWHRQGKHFIGEVGIDPASQSAEDHFKFWTGFYKKEPFLDGIIIDEFIVNNLLVPPGMNPSPEQLQRMEREQVSHQVYGQAIKQVAADTAPQGKTLYAYIGGSGKKLNQEMIGTNFIRTIIDSGSRVVLERYLHEMSSEQRSRDALNAFVEGIADWETKQPGVKNQMVIAFGLFSMPPGSINKQPNVDYHVWMDQQMNLVANHPALAGIAGLEWWTSSLADEETVRFVGKLYRHYGIDGNTNMLTRDPLFLTHIQNADFESGTEGWTLKPAEEGSIAPKSFPRYGRIEGRFMGLWRPADPEHIGDTFLWMKRSSKGPNTFSQTIKDLEPGRLYSMKMFSCDYQDLVRPMAKTKEQAAGFIGSVTLEGVDVDQKRSFAEMYPSGPEPKIPVWITYHWKVFRANGTTAKLLVSDWAGGPQETTFDQEQAFNFVEIEPYYGSER